MLGEKVVANQRRSTGKIDSFVYSLMRSDLPTKAPVHGLGIPWKVIWPFQRIAEMPVTARDAGQT
eukprot:6043891-Pleurochrysis_carterae.AAC.1